MFSVLCLFCETSIAGDIFSVFYLSPNSGFEEEKSLVLQELNEAQALADQIIAFKNVPVQSENKKEESPLPEEGKVKRLGGWIPTYSGYSSGGLEVDRARIIIPSYNYYLRHVVDTERKVEPSAASSQTRTVKDFDVDDGVLLPSDSGRSSAPSTFSDTAYRTSGELELFLKNADEKTASLLSMEPQEILLKKKIWHEALKKVEMEIARAKKNPYLNQEDKSRLQILRNYFLILLDKSDLALASREAMIKKQMMISG